MLADAVGEGDSSTAVCPGHERVLPLHTTIEKLNITEQGTIVYLLYSPCVYMLAPRDLLP